MEKRTAWLIVALLITPLVLMTGAPAAAVGNDVSPPFEVPEGSIVLNGETMEEIAALGVEMQNHLALGENGTLQLGEVDSEALGITDEYLENYKSALQYVNAAIKQGLFTVDDNFQVTWNEEAIAVDTEAPESTELESGYYHHAGHGVYTYFSYSHVRYYIPHYGLSTATSLASYVGYPHYATPYTYHFTYRPTYTYYYTYAYPSYGVWSYVPVGYLPYYSYGHYYPAHRYVYYWYPYGSYYYTVRCYY